jgi:hypothetical protein
MATPPTFTNGTALYQESLNAIGLWLVKSQAVGTGVSSVNVTGAFSADYDNYKIVYSGGAQGGIGGIVTLKLGASGTGYYNTLVYGNSYAVPTATGASTNNGAVWNFAGFGDPNMLFVNFELMQPFAAKYTGLTYSYISATNAGLGSGYHGVATSYSDFTITATGGLTLTGGTIRVYGYRN